MQPFLKKASRVLKVPILVARMRKSINIQKLISLKKFRKMKKYGYIREYQFSPSNSPLVHYHYYRKAVKKRAYEDLYSIFAIGRCLGMKRAADREYYRGYGYPLMELKALPCIENISSTAGELYETSEMSGGDHDDSIDERAEKFIERFYEEIRLQRQESFMQSNPFIILDAD